jgi:uncharacterized protein YdiU (UPF0061 family)
VKNACYSWVEPAEVRQPQVVAVAHEVAELLDLSDELLASADFADVFVGNRLTQGMQAYATCYGGHQFGVWAGQLGDGRAINLGEVVNQRGEHWTLQLKGAGSTPYSRRADGLAVLRSSIREFLCSEAMYHLGVPTTRALSVILTGETVIRDMFYNGNRRAEKGAVVCRVAPSFSRFGHLQILTARRDISLLKRFVDFTIGADFPHLGTPTKTVYAQWFAEVCQRTAKMIVHWQRVGFVHGVMNTDNMSLLGLTIDYGPYGWLEDYNPDWTPNTTDADEKRYRFGQQPAIAYWNLVQLANALYPLFDDVEPLQAGLKVYTETFTHEYETMLTAKLGLAEYDEMLCQELFNLLASIETDMTLFFRQLALVESAQEWAILKPAYYQLQQLTPDYIVRLQAWLESYLQKVLVPNEVRREKMNAVNPLYVLRNYLAQLAIDEAEKGDFTKVNELLALLRQPYIEQQGKEIYAEKRPDWARTRAGCSMLSCSS